MAEFRASLAGYRAFHREATGMHAGLEPFAEAIAARARGNAPVDTTAFRDSIHTERHTGRTYKTVRVVADGEGAVIIERRSNALGRAAG